MDTKHHLIVEYEVTNIGSDHGQLSGIASSAKSAMGRPKLRVATDRGHFSVPDTGVPTSGDYAVCPETSYLGVNEERGL